MKKTGLLSMVALLACSLSLHAAQPKHTFEIKDGQFVYDGQPTMILSGEMHYPRIPHEYWRHRLQMIKAMGLNTVATYVFWNAHEPQQGVWDFTGDNNLREFVQLAAKEGLHVILRPGPYVCAEWEFGGYPWWLQNIPGMIIRSDNSPFLACTKSYFDKLYEQVGDLLITRGGPIIMVQAENEFGSYVAQRKDISLEDHRRYSAKIKQQVLDAGFDVPLFTADGDWLFDGGSLPGVLPVANGEDDVENLRKTVGEYNGGKGPYMIGEFYPGWLGHWGEHFPRVTATDIARQTETYLKNDVSFNFYVIHGGTNFAFTSGANYTDGHDIQPDLTSYDYDAPITEAGWRTPKYDSIRAVIQKYTLRKLPAIPAAPPVIEIPSIGLTKVADIMGYLTSMPGTKASTPKTFEQLGQGYGYMLYSCTLAGGLCDSLRVPGLRDFAAIYVNGRCAGVLDRTVNRYNAMIDAPAGAKLDMLVENMGRINYGAKLVDSNKGIIAPVSTCAGELKGEWTMRGLPMDKQPDFSVIPSQYIFDNSGLKPDKLAGRPLLYYGQFDLQATGDTFLDMSGWGKGIVFVNGHNLGRYWKIGPQQTLYLPGVWLNKGRNTVVVFEQLPEGSVQTTLRGIKTPVLGELRR